MGGGSVPRRILANLDLECQLARLDAQKRAARGERAPRPDDPRFGLPREVAESISALGTLLRCLAREGDSLWTPRPVDPRRMAAAPGLPRPELESGPLERLEPTTEVLAWGEPGSLRVNHRAFLLETARSLGLALPGAALLRSVEEIEAHLAGGGAAASPGERWVLKAPLSASGRLRLRGKGPGLDRAGRGRAGRLLELFGVLLFEPWMERTADFGLAATVVEDGFRLLGLHRLDLAGGGACRGIELAPGVDPDAWLSPGETALFEETASQVAGRLRAAGYRGPFGLDGYRHRGAGGGEGFHPLGEINARTTFGLVARALLERVLGPDAASPGRAAALRIGGAEALEAPPPAGVRRIPLLLPGRGDPTAAWLETRR